MWLCYCSKKGDSLYESKPRGPRLTGKNAQLLREMTDSGSGFQDNAALDVGVVGKGYVDDIPSPDCPTPSKPARTKHSQKGLCDTVWLAVSFALVVSSAWYYWQKVGTVIHSLMQTVNASYSEYISCITGFTG